MKTAIYPGTFDPITYGHIDVIKKSLKIFDKVIVATTDNMNKNYHFSIDDRLSIINNSLFKDLRLDKKKIKVIAFDKLTINLCREYKAEIIIRGLRAVSDFEYEFQLAGMNKKLNPKIETMFMSDIENQTSSKFVKEIARRVVILIDLLQNLQLKIKINLNEKNLFIYFIFSLFSHINFK